MVVARIGSDRKPGPHAKRRAVLRSSAITISVVKGIINAKEPDPCKVPIREGTDRLGAVSGYHQWLSRNPIARLDGTGIVGNCEIALTSGERSRRLRVHTREACQRWQGRAWEATNS